MAIIGICDCGAILGPDRRKHGLCRLCANRDREDVAREPEDTSKWGIEMCGDLGTDQLGDAIIERFCLARGIPVKSVDCCDRKKPKAKDRLPLYLAGQHR